MILIAACVSGCVKYDEIDYDIDSPDMSVGDGSSISFKIPTMESVVSTRSQGADEYTINNGYLFVFDLDKTYKASKEITSYITWSTDDNSGNTFTISTDNLGYTIAATDKIVCVFNYDDATDNVPLNSISYDAINTYFPLSATYLEAVTKDLNDETYTYGMPMAVNDFEYGTSSGYHEVYRALARLEVFVLNNVDDGLTTGDSITGGYVEDISHEFNTSNVAYAIVNDVQSGLICEGAGDDDRKENSCYDASDFVADNETDGTITDDFFKYQLTEVTSSSTTDVTAKAGTNRIYLYPFNYSTKFIDGTTAADATTYSSDRFALLLKHTDDDHGTQYYKLNLFDKLNNNKYYDIERNHDYRIVITQVHSNGYDDLKEAYLAPPSNIDYEIYDDQSIVTLSNGQYAISMDEAVVYSQLDIYGDGEVEVRFDNISYVIPSEMTDFDMTDLTNEVNVTYSAGDLTVSVDNPFATDGKLTSTPQDVLFKISGDGSCTIGLTIKLGNLETGVGEITVNRYGTGGDGALDAHPAQLRYADRYFVEGSWSSTSTDFGARSASSTYTTDAEVGYDDGTVVLYMGHNATPVGYQTMDGAYTSASSEDSYPIFEDKSREEFYTSTNIDTTTATTNDKVVYTTTKVMVTQLKPYYLGHFGSTAISGTHHYNALISERIEEIAGGVDPSLGSESASYQYNGALMWHEDSWGATIYSSVYDFTTGRYLNLVEGNTISKYIVNEDVSKKAYAVQYCYMKNDINGNGIVEDDEEVKWYLPAQNQLLAMWISKYQYDSATIDTHKLSVGTGYSIPYYWSCSEGTTSDYVDSWTSFTAPRVINMLEGDGTSRGRAEWGGAHVRCVRGVTYDE